MKVTIQPFVPVERNGKRREVFVAKQTASVRKDTLSLSPATIEQARLMERMSDVSAIREELVERIKAEIEAGTYRIDSRRLAEFILKEGVV